MPDDWESSSCSDDQEQSITPDRPFGFFFLLLGFLVLEATASPSLAAVAVCLRFAVKNLATAAWLLWRDPRRLRGLACGLVYAGLGALKATGAAMGCQFVLEWVAVRGAPNVQRMETLAIVGGGFLLAGLAFSVTGIALAARLRVRLWISSQMFEEAVAGRWPPRPGGWFNQLGCLSSTCLTLGWLFLTVGALELAGPRLGLAAGLALSIGMLLGGVSFVLLARAIMLRIGARSAADCWPDEPNREDAYDGGDFRSLLDAPDAD